LFPQQERLMLLGDYTAAHLYPVKAGASITRTVSLAYLGALSVFGQNACCKKILTK